MKRLLFFASITAALFVLSACSSLFIGVKVFTNSAAIEVPANSTVNSDGPADIYPSTISVSGMGGVVDSVVVSLVGVASTYPEDWVVVLEGPSGEHTVLMADACGSDGMTGIDLTFDAAALTAIPDEFTPVSGTYLPGLYAGDFPDSEQLPAPGPQAPYVADLTVFDGTSPNGTWNLFIYDQYGGDVGELAGGWSLTIKTK